MIEKAALNKGKALVALVVTGAFLFSAPLLAQTKKIERITTPQTAGQTADQLEAQEEPTSSLPPVASSRSSGGGSDLQKHSVGLGVGQTFLNSDMHDQGKSSISPDLYYNYSASYSYDFIANVHLWSYKRGAQKIRTLGVAPGIKAKFYQYDNFAPFAIGGLGFYNPKAHRYVNGVIVESDGKWVFGYHLGGGVELRLNENFMVGALFHFHNPFDAEQDRGPEVEGSYQKLMLTAFYTFN